MTNSILKASDADNGGYVDHVDLVKSCLNTITLLSHISAKFTRKRKHNLRNIVHSDILALCAPKPGNTAAKVKPKNQRSTFLLGDNLKQAAKDARRSQELTKKTTKRISKGTGKLKLETKESPFWTMARKVVKITINHHYSGDHLSTTTTETIPPRSHTIPQGRNTTSRGMYA